MMPKKRRPAERRNVAYGAALVLSCLGLLLGLLALQSHPLAAGITVVTAMAGLMYSATEFCPVPKTYIASREKEIEDGDRRPR